MAVAPRNRGVSFALPPRPDLPGEGENAPVIAKATRRMHKTRGALSASFLLFCTGSIIILAVMAMWIVNVLMDCICSGPDFYEILFHGIVLTILGCVLWLYCALLYDEIKYSRKHCRACLLAKVE